MQLLKYVTFLFSLGWLVYAAIFGEIPSHIGDGLSHYFIANAAWSNPIELLNHWGKPLYTLILSPFAQFGFQGVIVFNLLVFSATIGIGYRILRLLKTPDHLAALLPLALLFANDIVVTYLSALTEPFFNLLLLASVYFMLQKKWLVFAIIVSFLPYTRSEGQLIIVLAIAILWIGKQFKALPFLLIGHLVYAFVGKLALGEFWWYFTNSPYAKESTVYGSGSWDHYLVNFNYYLGYVGLGILLVGMVSLLYHFARRKASFFRLDFWILSYGTFFGVLFVHSYFWTTGQYSSAGLTRIATLGVPLLLIVHLHYISLHKWVSSAYFSIASILLSILFFLGILKDSRYPIKAKGLTVSLLQTSNFLKQQASENHSYYHPFLYFLMDKNPRIDVSSITKYDGNSLRSMHDVGYTMDPGGFLVRESHFGPREAKLPLPFLDSIPELVLVKEIISPWQKADALDETEGVLIYQYIPIDQQDSLPSSEKIRLRPFSKYTLSDSTEVVMILDTLIDKACNLALGISSSSDAYQLIFDVRAGERYESLYFTAGETSTVRYTIEKEGRVKIYVWNPTFQEGTVTLNYLDLSTRSLHPIYEK